MTIDIKEKIDWNIIGHENILRILSGQINNNKLSHAYLFVGDSDLGKQKLALKFSQILFCSNYNKKLSDKLNKIPCNKCLACQYFQKHSHPDLIEINKNIDKKAILIDQIIELQKKLSLKSAYSNYKIAIINQAHDLNKEASNRLLKLLEEPYQKTIIILITDSFSKLLPTIISRCQIFRFFPLTQNDYGALLENKNLTQLDKLNLETVSQNKPNLINYYLTNPEALKIENDFLKTSLNYFNQNLNYNIKQFNKYLKKSANYNERLNLFNKLISAWQMILRDIILIKTGKENNIQFKSYSKKLNTFSKNITLKKINNIQFNILKAKKSFNYNPDINNSLYLILLKINSNFNS